MRDLIVAFVPSGANGGKGAGKRGINGCSTKPIKALPEEQTALTREQAGLFPNQLFAVLLQPSKLYKWLGLGTSTGLMVATTAAVEKQAPPQPEQASQQSQE